jgi:DNA-binding GntR family transcriptional regulator
VQTRGFLLVLVEPSGLALVRVELNRLANRMEQQAAHGGDGLADTDRAFRATPHRGLDDVLPSEVLEASWDSFHRVRADLGGVPQDPRITCRQHRGILDAVRSGDAIRAEGAIREHLGNIRALLSTTSPQGPHRGHNERV